MQFMYTIEHAHIGSIHILDQTPNISRYSTMLFNFQEVWKVALDKGGSLKRDAIHI